MCYIHPFGKSPPWISSFLPLHLLSLNRSHHFARVLRVPKLQVPNTLPRACIQSSIRNGYGNARANQRRLDMSRHIITALCIVQIQALALLVLGHYAIERRAHIRTHILVKVLVQRQRT